jgi:hypothetical protein
LTLNGFRASLACHQAHGTLAQPLCKPAGAKNHALLPRAGRSRAAATTAGNRNGRVAVMTKKKKMVKGCG